MNNHYDTKKEAKTEAQAVKKRMQTPREWQILVWENIGWHWSLRQKSGIVALNQCYGSPQQRIPRYYAMVGNDGSGRMSWTDVSAEFKDPNEAVIYALERAHAHIQDMIFFLQPAEALRGH